MLCAGPQGEALSKRLGTLALRDLREQGVAPEAILSLMARLGSSDPVELRATVQEVVDGFDISKFGSAPKSYRQNCARRFGQPFAAILRSLTK